ncbi:MAG TPA: hypothetical protein VKW04_18290 [Planctomycetota bacterium]|nr:hypothetical protein [Planctomycetota bacterium]
MLNPLELQKLGLKLAAALDQVGSSFDQVKARGSGQRAKEELPERRAREPAEMKPGLGGGRRDRRQVELGRDLPGLGAELVALEEKAERPLTPPRDYENA